MAITRSRFYQFLKFAKREDLHLVVVVFVSWCIVLSLYIPGHTIDPVVCVLFAASASLMTHQCFSPFHRKLRLQTLPGWSEFIGIILSVPVAGLLVYGFLNVSLHYSLTGTVAEDLWFLLIMSPAIANITFAAEIVLSLVLLVAGVKRRVILDLLPEQEKTLRDVLADSGLIDEAELYSRSMLRVMLSEDPRTIDYLIISKETARSFSEQADLISAHLSGVPVLDSCHVCASLSKKISLPLTDSWTFLNDALPQTFARRAYRSIKFILEPVLAGILAILFFPLLAAIAFAIRMAGDGNILYRQERLGFRGKTFTLIKFRTMREDAEKDGPRWAQENDNRVTPLGSFLRRTRMDELPQLWNVLRGDMSFVGPRPERPEIYQQLQEQVPLFFHRTIVRPGITGWAQVKAGYAASVEESHLKLEYDLYYIQNISLSLDLNVVARTLLVAIAGEKRVKRLRRMIPYVKAKCKSLRRKPVASIYSTEKLYADYETKS